MPYPGHSLGWTYSAAEMQLVYSTGPADWAGLLKKSMTGMYINNDTFYEYYEIEYMNNIPLEKSL